MLKSKYNGDIDRRISAPPSNNSSCLWKVMNKQLSNVVRGATWAVWVMVGRPDFGWILGLEWDVIF